MIIKKMDKELFIAVCDRLKSKAPSLRWIDAEDGQLSSSERPSVAFPCALVDMSYVDCRTIPGSFGNQRVKANITIRVAFQKVSATNTDAPTEVRFRALGYYDVLREIHKKALQWWNGGGLFNPMCRLRCIPEKRNDGLKVFTMVYETEFSD